MGWGLKLHERHDIVHAAELEARRWLMDWEKRHGLTALEAIRCHASWIQTHTKYEIRMERHGNYEKKGDEA